MGNNDIRLRRTMMNSGRMARYRNYPELMARHEREGRIRRIVKVFMYFLIIVFLTIILLVVVRWEKRHAPEPKAVPAQPAPSAEAP